MRMSSINKKGPEDMPPGHEEDYDNSSGIYEARAARRGAAADAMTTALTGGLTTLVLTVARATVRAFTVKHFSSARSTCCSISSAFSRMTSDTSEMISALARSNMRFSRNERLLDLLKNVRLLRTSAMS